MTTRGGKIVLAHRLAWEEQKGAIPYGLYVLHKCDNPACVNIEHLFLGTQKDNVHDMLNKGRGRTGMRRGYLAEGVIHSLFMRFINGEIQRRLAEEAGVSYEHLNRRIKQLSSGKS